MQPEDPVVQRMKAAASKAAERAYCPYSRFRVGAAVLTEDGGIFSGCNVENASLGLTLCAERNAIVQAVARGHRRIRAVVIVTDADPPTPPCGACLQVMREFGPRAQVFSFGRGGQVLKATLPELLPHPFGSGNLP